MRQFTTLAALTVAVLSFGGTKAAAQESLLQEYMQAFAGRWVCETPAVQDIEGCWKKGEMIVSELVYTPVQDQSGMRYEMKFTKDGQSVIGAHGICTWDAASKAIKTYGFAPGGFHVEVRAVKEGGKWISKGVVTHPDGKTSHSTVSISFSADGETQTSVLVEGADKAGVEMDDFTQVSEKISKNQEVLEKELAWIIGEWECEVELPGMGNVTFESKYKWISDKNVIQLNMIAGEWKGLSIIFYDPADEKIKMWGANSFGGNGQAVLEIDGDDLVWTNTVFDAEGQKSVDDFTYVKTEDPDSFMIKYVDEVDNTAKQVTVKKHK